MPTRNINFREVFDTLPTPFMILDKDLKFAGMNEAYLETTQRTRDELMGRYVFDVFPEKEEREAKFKAAFEDGLAGEETRMVKEPFSIPRPESEGGGMREVFWNITNTPIRDSSGKVAFVLQHAFDVTAQVEAERHTEVISAELDHRVKNLLAVVTAIGRRTAASSHSMEDFTERFSARIDAISRTHGLLSEGDWDGTTLEALLANELVPYRDERRERISLNGPPVSLNAREAQSLSMAFHELATNAVKYGALSLEDGDLEIDWTARGADGEYSIRWRETGHDGLTPPTRTGFGSMVIDRFTKSQLGAHIERRFEPTGLVCEIVVAPKDGDQNSRA